MSKPSAWVQVICVPPKISGTSAFQINVTAATATTTKAMNSVTITLANQGGQSFTVDRRKPLLDSLEAQGVSLPYGCKYGGCISCAAKLLAGEVDQRAGVALNGRQLAHGYVLLCIARPLSDCTFDVGVENSRRRSIEHPLVHQVVRRRFRKLRSYRSRGP